MTGRRDYEGDGMHRLEGTEAHFFWSRPPAGSADGRIFKTGTSFDASSFSIPTNKNFTCTFVHRTLKCVRRKKSVMKRS